MAQNWCRPKHQRLGGDKAKPTVPIVWDLVLEYCFLVTGCLGVMRSWPGREPRCALGTQTRLGFLRLVSYGLTWRLYRVDRALMD